MLIPCGQGRDTLKRLGFFTNLTCVPMRRSARMGLFFGWLLVFATASAALANTVAVHHYHRHARSAHHSAARRHASAHTTAGTTPTSRAARSSHAKASLHRAAAGTTSGTAAAPHVIRGKAATRQRRAQLQTVRMSRRYPRMRRRASLRTVSFRWASPLAGSRESLMHQNEMAEAEGLERIQDDADLDNRIAAGSLVPVPVTQVLRINEDLPQNRRYCRPWTADFLRTLAQAHAEAFPGSPLEVTSAVRTVAYQRRLRHINGNAAAADGDLASPHLTGGTIDLGKKGMSRREIAWMRNWLLPLQQAGKIDVEEEFRQACFHISVYKSFDGEAPGNPEPATTMAAGDDLMNAPGH